VENFSSEFYQLCEDEDCEYNYAYRFDGSSTHHFHYIGPKQPVEQDPRQIE